MSNTFTEAQIHEALDKLEAEKRDGTLKAALLETLAEMTKPKPEATFHQRGLMALLRAEIVASKYLPLTLLTAIDRGDFQEVKRLMMENPSPPAGSIGAEFIRSAEAENQLEEMYQYLPRYISIGHVSVETALDMAYTVARAQPLSTLTFAQAAAAIEELGKN